jgi:hypothetical protein
VSRADEVIATIRRLYFQATKRTILDDFATAIDLLKSLDTPDERQRATVYMQGLAEMRKEFGAHPAAKRAGPPKRTPAARPKISRKS